MAIGGWAMTRPAESPSAIRSVRSIGTPASTTFASASVSAIVSRIGLIVVFIVLIVQKRGRPPLAAELPHDVAELGDDESSHGQADSGF